MDEHGDKVRIEQVGPKGVSRAVPMVTFLIGIFLGAAFVKPWDIIFAPGAAPAQPAPVVVAAASSTPAPSPTPAGSRPPAECAFAGGWRIFALGQRDSLGGDGSTGGGADPSPGGVFSDIGNPLRRWLEVAPLDSVSGPDDTRIPFVTIVSSRITAVGYCPPPGGSDGPPTAAGLEAWSIDAAGVARQLTLQPVGEAGAPGTTEVEVFISTRDVPTGGRWAAGRYVFAVATRDGSYGRWYGLEIRTPPGPPSGL